MSISRLRTVSTHHVGAAWRLVALMPLLLTLLAACSKGTGGGPAY
ncbi:MAG: hypothetical protein ACJ77V_05190 [Chloroflexota bacterium]|jgi:hypothetical protein